jgi:hypothetical protein
MTRRKLRDEEKADRKAELGRIREVRGDVYTGPAARLIPEISDNRPWPSTPNLEIRNLSGGELMAAIDLGILTLDLLLQKERIRLTEAKKTYGGQPPKAVVISLLSMVIGSD